jgi:AraC family transcriptional regulator, transcriptional activator FtrA
MVTIGRRPAERAHTVAVVAFPGMNPFELGCVIEVFGLPRPELELGLGPDRAWYDFKVCAETRAPMAVVGGLRIGAEFGLADFAAADTLIVTAVPDVRERIWSSEGADSAETETGAAEAEAGRGRSRGRGKPEAAEERAGSVSPALLTALREGHARGARIVSICSGAFALAEAGLLDGLEATTHWQYADLLARRFPAVRVNPDVLYVDSGQILTSAGSAAGLDLCLHLIRLDYGAAIANSVARRLVLPPHRDGGQAQFIEGGVRPVDASGGGVARSMAWALEHLAERIAVVDLARVAVMSERTYIRQFGRATGTAPLRWLVAQRVAAARALLETADASVEEIGAAVGFSDPAGFRRHFVRAVGASPSAYRRTFHPKVGKGGGARGRS